MQHHLAREHIAPAFCVPGPRAFRPCATMDLCQEENVMLRTCLAVLVCLVAALIVLPAPALAQEPLCSEPLPLVIGQNIYNRPGVFIRNLPTRSGGRVAYHASSVTLRVVGGPVCADGYNWWQVEGPVNPGWIAEGTPDFRLIFSDDTYVLSNDCAAPLALNEGDGLRLLVAARVRAVPGFSARVLSLLQANVPLTVRGAAQCVDGANWWPVWVPAGGELFTEGWVAQSDEGDTLIEPVSVIPAGDTQACAPPYYRLAEGVRAVVTYRDTQPKNLRTAPDRDATIVNQLIEGIAVDLLDGPVCADGLNWWQVRVVGSPETVGWMAEGGTAAGGYWLLPQGLQ